MNNNNNPNAEFHRNWHKIMKQILKQPGISIEKKLLAYKVFLRPMLIHNWFQESAESAKILEVKALRQIFGKFTEERLYERYTDINITCYLRLQELVWKRATSSHDTNVRNMLSAVCQSRDPTPYFTNGTGRQRQSYRRRRQRARQHHNSIDSISISEPSGSRTFESSGLRNFESSVSRSSASLCSRCRVSRSECPSPFSSTNYRRKYNRTQNKCSDSDEESYTSTSVPRRSRRLANQRN